MRQHSSGRLSRACSHHISATASSSRARRPRAASARLPSTCCSTGIGPSCRARPSATGIRRPTTLRCTTSTSSTAMSFRSTTASRHWRGWLAHTLVEKILLAHCDANDVKPGDVITVRCDVVMANDVSGPVAFRAMEKMGVERVFDPARVVMVADHFVPAKDARSAELQARLKRWSNAHGVTFYGQGRGGIEHTLLCEEGWIVPGSVIAGGDSHTCTYGALGAFGTGLGSTDIASCPALGSFWQAVPETILVELTGSPGNFVTGKDVILAVLAQIGVGGGTNAVLEFVGPGAEALSVDERLAVANMAVEAGSETGIFPADRAVETYLEGRARSAWTAGRSDPDAPFPRPDHAPPFGHRLPFYLSPLEPLVALPHLPGNVAAVSDAAGVTVDQVYIGNC